MNRETIMHHFQYLPLLDTPRLHLRKILLSDAEDMYAYASLEAVTQYLLWNCHPSEEYTRQYIAYLETKYRTGDFFDWAVTLRSTGRMIGTCGFTKFDMANASAEIGYVFHPEVWNCGYAKEAVSSILAFGFHTLDLHRIEARFMLENQASRHVMEHCGMRFEGIYRDGVYAKGRYHDVGVCAILRGDFQ